MFGHVSGLEQEVVMATLPIEGNGAACQIELC